MPPLFRTATPWYFLRWGGCTSLKMVPFAFFGAFPSFILIFACRGNATFRLKCLKGANREAKTVGGTKPHKETHAYQKRVSTTLSTCPAPGRFLFLVSSEIPSGNPLRNSFWRVFKKISNFCSSALPPPHFVLCPAKWYPRIALLMNDVGVQFRIFR